MFLYWEKPLQDFPDILLASYIPAASHICIGIKLWVFCLVSVLSFTLLLLLLAARSKESAYEFFPILFFSLFAFFWSWKENWMDQIISSADNCSCLIISNKGSWKMHPSPRRPLSSCSHGGNILKIHHLWSYCRKKPRKFSAQNCRVIR